MSLNNYEHGNRKKAIKKSARIARSNITKFMRISVSRGETNSPAMAKASGDYITTYSSSCLKQLNMIVKAYG